MEGSIVIASCFEPGTVVELLRAPDELHLRPDASCELVDRRVVDAKELVGFRGDHLQVGALYFARGLFRGHPNVVRVRPDIVEVGSGELAQPVYTLQQPAIAIGTQEAPRVPDKPVEARPHLGVGVQEPGEPLHPGPRPADEADAADWVTVGTPAPPVAPSGLAGPTTLASVETTAPEHVPPPPSPEPPPTEPLEPPPPADEPPPSEPAPAVEAPAGAAPAHGTDLPALVGQAVALGIADNAASMSVEELRQAIRDKGQEPVA